MKTQRDDILKEILQNEIMMGHAKMMGDKTNHKKFKEKANWLRSSLTHME